MQHGEWQNKKKIDIRFRQTDEQPAICNKFVICAHYRNISKRSGKHALMTNTIVRPADG